MKNQKTGRNAKCWCGSDKKYKHCHYGRDTQKPVTKGDAINASKGFANRKSCYVPAELYCECETKIINAHTVSKSSTLKAIADNTNHVLGLKINLPNLFKGEGELEPEKIGINQASTFKGFCAKHDKELFSCVEDRHFVGDEEQNFALMYRSVAKELYAKEGSLQSAEFLKGADKGKDPFQQMMIQEFASGNMSGVDTGHKELSEFKALLDEHLLKKSDIDLCHVIFESSSSIAVVASSIVSPINDFNGQMIQDLGDLDVKAEGITFNTINSDGKGFVVFSWLKSAQVIKRFMDSLLSIEQSDIFSALIRFFFESAENTYISPKWWDALDDNMRDRIKELIMSGVNPFAFEPDNLLVDDGIKYPGWAVEKVTKVNF
jgi:hypothetical protein